MSTNQNQLGKRMKRYEATFKNYLIPRSPAIIRVDGKNFSTYTKQFRHPFDPTFSQMMQQTATYLCENIQGCVLAYTQSDEISLILKDYDTYTTQPWFNYNVQKLSSIAASMATMKFNELVAKSNATPNAMFDARCFTLVIYNQGIIRIKNHLEGDKYYEKFTEKRKSKSSYTTKKC